MKRKDLAAELGLSPQAVSKLCKRGMPDHSVEAAVRWRRRHLEQTRCKGFRLDTRAAAAPRAPAARGDPGADDRAADLLALDLVHQLRDLVRMDFDTWVGRLRAALRALPLHMRQHVELDVGLWRRLAAEPLGALFGTGDEVAEGAARAADEQGDELMGELLFAFAAGDVVVVDGCLSPGTRSGQQLLAAVLDEL